MSLHRTCTFFRAALATSALVSCGVAQQPVPRVIYSTFDASGTSHVPGTDPTAHFRWFDRPACDPSGTWIVFSADIDANEPVNQVIIVRGTAASAPGTLRVREGGLISGSLYNGPMHGPLAIRADGSFAYKTNLQPPPPPAPQLPEVENDDALVRFNGAAGTFTIAVREGDAVPGYAPEKIGTYLESAQVLQDGNLAFVAGATWGLTDDGNLPEFAARDEFVIKAGQVQLRAGVDAPNGYDGPPATRTWDHFEPDKCLFLLTPDGTTYLLKGDLTGDPNYNDNVVAYGGEVVLQQRRRFPVGDADPNHGVFTVKEIDLSPGGAPNPHWMAYGKYSYPYDPNYAYREYEFLARDGERIAMTGDVLQCSPTGQEKLRDADWNETFFLLASNATGEYLYGTFTGPLEPNQVDPNDQSDVLVWVSGASKRPVLRSGLRADIDGDGVANPAIDPLILSFKESSAC